MSKRARKLMRETAKYIFLTAVGIIMFKYASAYATAQRGREAIGGEYFLLLLPVIYAAVADIVHGTVREIAKIFVYWRNERRWRTSRYGTDAHAAHVTTPGEKPTDAHSATFAQSAGL